jgi:carboxypeptidase Taq
MPHQDSQTPTAFTTLKDRLALMTDINLAYSVLGWDQATMLPEAGAHQRGRMMASLSQLSHDIITAKETTTLLSSLAGWASNQPESSFEGALIREAKRVHDLETRVPSKLNTTMTEHYARMYSAWAVARPQNDFKTLRPLLAKAVDLNRQFSDCFPGMEHPLDALIQYSDPGITVSIIRELFAKLRDELVPLVKKVTSGPVVDSRCLEGDFDAQLQLEFCKKVAATLGYDFTRGRIDLSPHPFMTRLSGGDIRITTRARRQDLTDCLFSVIHEVGHALYEMGIRSEFDGNILGGGVSSGIHESQSRLWENRVGRSRAFWDHFYPILRATFPHFKTIPQDTFLKAINKVEPGLIRVDADELTYNLHVMIRFDLECQMMEGKLAVKDLPDAWNSRYKSDLGVTSADHKDGCLQDVHWFSGRLGSFQGYTIGNILSAQFYDAASRQLGCLEDDFARGDFSRLRGWLHENLHQYGSSRSPESLVLKATKSPMTIRPYMDYLSKKYGNV